MAERVSSGDLPQALKAGPHPLHDVKVHLQAIASRFLSSAEELKSNVVHKALIFRHKLHLPTFHDGHLEFASDIQPISASDAAAEALAAEAERTKRLALELSKWRRRPEWTDQTPDLKVTAPLGSFCELNCTFVIGLPPDAVYDILCDPGNDRVFKNIKATKSRTVLEDRGLYQRVLVEQTAIWHFLWLTGTFDVNMEVATDKKLRQISYKLAEGGFMKRFEGNWEIGPLQLGGEGKLIEEESGLPKMKNGIVDDRLASRVQLRQSLQPAVRLPPPISGYVRGISASATRSMIADLQAEAQRVRNGVMSTDDIDDHHEKRAVPPIIHDLPLHSGGHRKGSDLKRGRRKRNTKFREKLRQNFRVVEVEV